MQQVPQSRVYKKQLNINNTANNKKVQKPLASWMFRESILLDDQNKNAAKYLKHSLNILIQLWIYLPNLNALSANLAKWSNTLKQFVGNLPTNYLGVFDYFEGLTLKGLNQTKIGCFPYRKLLLTETEPENGKLHSYWNIYLIPVMTG